MLSKGTAYHVSPINPTLEQKTFLGRPFQSSSQASFIMVYSRETKIYRKDARKKVNGLTPQQREELIKPYLPLPPKARAIASRKRFSQPARDFATNQLHLLIFTIIHTLFSIYIRLRQTYHVIVDKVFAILYYHHKAPELIRQDVKNLSRLPEHLSIILDLKREEKGTAALEALMDEVAEIAAWCACVGIPMLSVYEKTGIPTLLGLHREV